MQGTDRKLVNSITYSEALRELDAKKALEAAQADDLEFGLADQAALEQDRDWREELARLGHDTALNRPHAGEE